MSISESVHVRLLMHTIPWIAAVLASTIWIGFAVCMKYYFRFSGQRTWAKTLLVGSAYACTLTQIMVLALEGRPEPVPASIGIAGYVLAGGLFAWALLAHGRSRPAF